MEKKILPFTSDEALSWQKKRKQGKLLFSLVFGGKWVGLPMYIVIMLLTYKRIFGFSLADTNSKDWFGYIYADATSFGLLALFISYYAGQNIWNRNEASYHDYCKKHPDFKV
ncbi:hypothetical protein SG34_008255 [Thalassomonas viridans]|uniref:Uncharacterized protein n=1 Tax=Thalassomonas viridans TaxID=137584 RepID=A0AAE9Z7T4_9GAMM|nr:hypothetical protein [Thalassomonas viridans]WDE06878.1 hypothetical protein SG34_008255 [Thalassomonas viridans]